MPYEYTREATICESECVLLKKSVETDENGVVTGETIRRKIGRAHV